MNDFLSSVREFKADKFSATTDQFGVQLHGSSTSREPHASIQPYLRRVHEATVRQGKKTLMVDVTDLAFINSSTIRLFVDWGQWILEEPDSHRYKLVFVTSSKVKWQRTSFKAIEALGEGWVEVRKS